MTRSANTWSPSCLNLKAMNHPMGSSIPSPTPSHAPKFSSLGVLDLGASKPQGNFRYTHLDDSGNPMGTEHKSLVSETRVKSSEEMFQALANRITAAIQSDLLDGAEGAKELKAGVTPLHTLVALVPGPVKNNVLQIFANLKTDTTPEEPIRNIDFDQLPHKLDSVKAALPESFPLKVMAFNDMMGGAAYVAQQLVLNRHKYGFLSPNQAIPDQFYSSEALLVITGGGMGVAKIRWQTPGEVQLLPTELGHTALPNSTPSQWGGEPTSLEGSACSVSGLLKNFASAALGPTVGNDLSKLLERGEAQAVTNQAKCEEILGHTVPTELFEHGAKHAIFQYINGLAILLQSQLLSGNRLTVLSGPVANGINQFLTEHQEDVEFKRHLEAYGQRNPHDTEHSLLGKMVLEFMHQLSDPVGKGLLEGGGYRLITDLPVENNLLGAPLLTKAELQNSNDPLAPIHINVHFLVAPKLYLSA